MGKWWFKEKQSADDFSKSIYEDGYRDNVEESSSGGYTVNELESADKETKELMGEEYRERLDREIAESKRRAVKDAELSWDDALPDESPIGKTQAELDRMESDEKLRLKHAKEESYGDKESSDDKERYSDNKYDDEEDKLVERERKRELADLRYEADKHMYESRKNRYKGKSNFTGTANKVLKIAGVGGINKGALKLYGANNGGGGSKDNGLGALRQLTDPSSGGLNNLRILTTTPSINNLTSSKNTKIKGRMSLGVSPILTISPIEAISTGVGHKKGGKSPLEVASTQMRSSFVASPLAMEATKIQIQESKIGSIAVMNTVGSFAFKNPSISSAKTKKKMAYKRKVNKIKRSR
jgi:hypothetical protein